MPPKKTDGAPAEDGIPSLTAGDVKMIDMILKNSAPEAKPNAVNWTKVVSQLNLKDMKSAKERFRQVCKKYQWFEGSGNAEEGGGGFNGGGSAPVTPSPRARKTANKRLASDLADAGSEDGGSAKKRRMTPKSAAKTGKVKAEATKEGEGDGLDGVPDFVAGEV
ncbi:hypothetical protein F4779DRAFT_580110 [Xylariaceae sp. FL0662B]|nr:hypothetical protein F4779DRAFT_580110 [Xylariaceae sp. FL0662B]